MNIMSNSTPLPRLKAEGSKNLDSLLHSTVAKQNLPAIFCAATNVNETFYSNQDGHVVFGDEGSGKVDSDTSELMFSARTKVLLSIRY